MTTYDKIPKEETFKAHIFAEYFGVNRYGYKPNIDNIDFVVSETITKDDTSFEYHYLWAETKKDAQDIESMLTQLILTCKKTYIKGDYLPPKFIGCFDTEKIAFVSFHDVLPIFNESDFNWNQTPSNHETTDFKKARSKINNLIAKKIALFHFATDKNEIQQFIKDSFILEDNISQIPITKDNFVHIYRRWVKEIKPSIDLIERDWNDFKNNGILDGDFFRADMMSSGGNTITEKLKIILKQDCYKLQEVISGRLFKSDIGFTDGGVAYKQFWNKYKRPPEQEYQQFIIDRRDLLVPQNIRELKGSFFTPKIWADKSKEYLEDVFGKNWQDRYYVWDCAAGTGNLLAGLKNKYNVWASTIDQSDVDTMKTLIDGGLNLLEDHVFKFDFLNDSFDKLPDELKTIIDDPNKRKKLIVYINPPYAEGDTVATNRNKRKGIGDTLTYKHYSQFLGGAASELFMQFIIRIYKEIPHCKLALFSKLKYITAPKSSNFRTIFKAEYKGGFIVQADTFDNVIGHFPIGFLIWDFEKEHIVNDITCDVISDDKTILTKTFHDGIIHFLNDWLKKNYDKNGDPIGTMGFVANDFQHQKFCFLSTKGRGHHQTNVTKNNLIEICIYFTVRHCIKPTWINDRDQFLYPNDKYKNDLEFQNDCLIFTLFHGQNRISCKDGVNHWIPFTEKNVNAKEKFKSNFMSNFLKRKKFSVEAKAVLDAGRKLWRYYHAQIKQNRTASVNASFYDVRAFFQGQNEKGSMKNKSKNETYNNLIADLRNKLKTLADKIQPKIYKYGFLKK
ncbi:MAG: hypothetical protein LBP59_01135 [Planctomycetaceae bacterium]|jgi:hypothetical protein|nr:hypothetical protein [Planctomycetaceae bacterium]